MIISLICRVTESLPFTGRHQTDQPTKAAEEGADHQRDLSDEGAKEPQHSQLFRQVRPTAAQHKHLVIIITSRIDTSVCVTLCICVCLSVS